jgi:hypothetical protein
MWMGQYVAQPIILDMLIFAVAQPSAMDMLMALTLVGETKAGLRAWTADVMRAGARNWVGGGCR